MMSSPIPANPYVGPRPFLREDRERFFGRDQEANELLSLVVANRTMLLYAQSGAGKTSLLNAQVVPLLEKEGFEVLPFARVQGPMLNGIDPASIPNLYVFYSLLSWEEWGAEPEVLIKQTITEYLNGRPHQTDGYGDPRPRVLVFDQFEELFTAWPGHWQDREGFFNQLNHALQAHSSLRVVFSMREDYIAQLDPYTDLLPKSLKTRFRLERMRPGQALEAVRRPLLGTEREFAPGVAEQLVEDLRQVRVETAVGDTNTVTGEFIESVQLQVVCQNLWQDLPADVTTITHDHLKSYGNVNQALARFYERAIQQTTQARQVAETSLRNWFEHTLITPAGTRGTVYRGRETSGNIPNSAVEGLENLHLIRGELRAGSRWYELTHDRMIEPIQQSNRIWDEKQREIRFIRLRRIGIGAVFTIFTLFILFSLFTVVFNRLENVAATASAASREAELAMAAQVTAEIRAAATQTIFAQQVAETATAGVIAAEATSGVRITSEANSAATVNAQATAAVVAAVTDVANLQGTSSAVQAATSLAQNAVIATLAAQITPETIENNPGIILARAEFFDTITNRERVELLASLFNLSPNQQNQYDEIALDLFFALETNEKLSLFSDDIDWLALQPQLIILVQNISLALNTLPDNEDITILEVMIQALSTADPTDSAELITTLQNWQTGRTQTDLGQYDQAITAFSSVIDADGGSPLLYYDRGFAYYQTGNFEAALSDFNQAVQLINGVNLTSDELLQIPGTGEGFIFQLPTLENIHKQICDSTELRGLLEQNPDQYILLENEYHFGEQFAFTTWPTEYQTINQYFGANPQNYALLGLPGHEGLDIMAPTGSKIFTVADGRVYNVHTESSTHPYGIHVQIEHWAGCEVYRTIYGQLQGSLVVTGQNVQAGELIALADNTGNSFGSHLHLTLKQDGVDFENYPANIIDPTPFIAPLLNIVSPDGPYIEGWAFTAALFVVGDLAQVGSGGLNLRAGPSQNDNLIGFIPEGTVLIITGPSEGDYMPVLVPGSVFESAP